MDFGVNYDSEHKCYIVLCFADFNGYYTCRYMMSFPTQGQAFIFRYEIAPFLSERQCRNLVNRFSFD